MLGDGVWEGMRVYKGGVAFLSEHLKRLYAGAKTIDMDIGLTPEELSRQLFDCLKAQDMTDGVHIRMMVTRGVKARPFQHPSLSRSGPTVAIILEHSTPAERVQEQGIRLATVPQVRGLPMAQDAKYNSHSKLNCVIACLQAEQAGADEGLMLDPHGFVNTTNACNFFIVKKGAVWTSTGDYCMNGITRQHVIDLCRENDIPVFERNYSLVDTYGADEAFMTGSFGGLTPVGGIDQRQLPTAPGPVTQRLSALYKALIADHVRTVSKGGGSDDKH